MEPCTDCGNTPKPEKRALFLDLDWTLIRPSLHNMKATIPDSIPAKNRRIHAESIIKLPKDSTDINYYENSSPTPNSIEVGFMYRPVFSATPHQWEFVPGMLEAIKPFLKEGFMIVLISNQGGIQQGFQTEEEIEQKLSNILYSVYYRVLENDFELELYPNALAYFYCPYFKEHPDRKPNPGMILRAAAKHNINLKKSFFVGDMKSDEEAARHAEIPNFFYVDTFLKLSPFVTLGVKIPNE
jgi:D-glycero-D-manno-heptose 1,7-bisphosphate phosphatase